MPSAGQRKRVTATARPLLSDAPAPPDVYHSLQKLNNRWVFYALGLDGAFLGCRHPRFNELDADVIEQLEELVRGEPRPTSVQLVNEDTIIAAGFDPVFHPPLSMPRLVR